MGIVITYLVFSIIISFFMSRNVRKDVKIPRIVKIYPSYYLFSYIYLNSKGKRYWLIDKLLLIILISSW